MSYNTAIGKISSVDCFIYQPAIGRINFYGGDSACAIMKKTKNDKWMGTFLPDHPCKSERVVIGTKTSVARRCLRFSIKGDY